MHGRASGGYKFAGEGRGWGVGRGGRWSAGEVRRKRRKASGPATSSYVTTKGDGWNVRGVEGAGG